MADSHPTLGSLTRTTVTDSKRLRPSAWWLPGVILLGFALIFLLLFRDRLIPAKSMRVTPAMAISLQPAAEMPLSSGKPLFQASGWIEPDPLPIKATALTDGVINEVRVLQGQPVRKGDPLATLIAIDTRLRRDSIAAELEMKKAELDAHCTGTQIAIQKMEAEEAALTSTEADVEEADDRLARLRRTPGGAIPEADHVAARLETIRSRAAANGRRARIQEIAHEINRIAYQTVAMQAAVKAAEIELEQAELALMRTTITAPADGRVLRLLAAPGQKKMIGMDEEDSATIAILYQPDKLQVRVDVPLADAAGLGVGQRAKIRCNLLPDRIFDGEVTRITGEADLQRNTLQAKVRIIDPDEKLRPEMICRVEFLDTLPQESSADSPGEISVFIRESSLTDNNVWICDPDSKRVSLRPVTATSETREGYLRLESGVRPGEWVVDQPSGLTTGQRIRPVLPSS